MYTDLQLGSPIAEGRTAELYAWHDGRVLKLYRDWCPRDWVAYEARIAHAVQAAGLPVPAAGDVVEVNGRVGLVYERVDGLSMSAVMRQRPWRLPSLARLLAELHAQMHHTAAAPGLPPLRQRLERKLRAAEALPSALRDRLLARLADLPDGDRLCHGDFHPENVLLAARGPVVIDWVDAAAGPPLADVARTSVVALAYATSAGVVDRWATRLFHTLYLRRYFQMRPEGQEQYQLWLPVVVAARLSENIADQQAWLLATAAEGYSKHFYGHAT